LGRNSVRARRHQRRQALLSCAPWWRSGSARIHMHHNVAQPIDKDTLILADHVFVASSPRLLLPGANQLCFTPERREVKNIERPQVGSKHQSWRGACISVSREPQQTRPHPPASADSTSEERVKGTRANGCRSPLSAIRRHQAPSILPPK
jgi:hypothetical protein